MKRQGASFSIDTDVGIHIMESQMIPAGLAVVAQPKDLEEFYAAPWTEEGFVPSPPPCSQKIVVIDLRDDKTVPALLSLWLAGQKKESEGAP